MIRSTSVGRVALAVLLAGCGLVSAGCAGSSTLARAAPPGERSPAAAGGDGTAGPDGTVDTAGTAAGSADPADRAGGSVCGVLTHLYADLVADAAGLDNQARPDDGRALADQVAELSGQVPTPVVRDLRVVAQAYAATVQALDAATPDDPPTVAGSTEGLDRRLDQVTAADKGPEVTGALHRLSAYLADGCR